MRFEWKWVSHWHKSVEGRIVYGEVCRRAWEASARLFEIGVAVGTANI